MRKTKQLFVLITLTLYSILAVGQNAKIEELKLRLKNAKHDTTRVITLYKLATYYGYISDYGTAITYADKSIQLGESIHYQSGCANAYNNKGTIYFHLGNYPEAMKNYRIASKYSIQSNTKEVIVSSFINIGILYAMQKEYAKAMKCFNSSAAILKETKDLFALGDLYNNIGSLYAEQGMYQEAIKSNLISLKYYIDFGSKNGIVAVYLNLGEIYFKQQDYTNALKYNFEALKLSEEIKSKEGISNASINIGDINLKQKKTNEAITYLNKAVALAKEIGILNNMSLGYKKLSDAYYSQNNYNEALLSFKNHIIYRDSIFNSENTRKIVQSQMQYDFDKKEAAIKAEQAIKAAVASEEIQKQRLLKYAIAITSLLLIFIILLFFNRRKAKHNLQVNKLENKTLRSQLNPHFIFNALASIQKYMNEHPELAENYLAKFGKLMREVLENSEKDYISLEDEFAMLKNYMDLEKLRVNKSFNYEFNMHQNIDSEEIKIPPLLLQPIVENAIWHGVAHAKSKGSITISTSLKDEVLLIEIENYNEANTTNNKTLEENMAKRKSFGLQIVKERLALLSKEKRKSSNLELIPTTHGMLVKILIPI